LKPKDRDFVETQEGLIWCVVGYLHPPNGYTAYLKYSPGGKGPWKKGGVAYSRMIAFYNVQSMESTYGFIETHHPEYLVQCPVRNIRIPLVPKHRVKKYYRPQERLREVRRSPRDPLEERLSRLVELLEGAGVPAGSLGVTGSILTSIHNAEISDIDLTVYGYKASKKAQESLQRLGEEGEIHAPSPMERGKWVERRSTREAVDRETLERFASRRWNIGFFEGTFFSVHPTRLDEEIQETYGENTYHKLDEVEGEAVVADARESIFSPAVWRLEDCTLEGVERLVSFESLYGGMFREGERISFRGVLEEVRGRDPHRRVVVGGASSQGSYIKWV